MRTLFLAALAASACYTHEAGPASLPPGDYAPRKEEDELALPKVLPVVGLIEPLVPVIEMVV